MVCENSSQRYISEADLEYRDELNKLHDYPLVSEKLEISRDVLSKHCSDIADQYGINVGGVNKLVPNLGNKSRYVFHYRNIQMFLALGMKLICVHRILDFKQSDWLKNILILILIKKRILSIALKRIFLS